MSESAAQAVQVAGAADEQVDRFRQAADDLKKIQGEIAPFLRRKRFGAVSTAGDWREASSPPCLSPRRRSGSPAPMGG